MMISWPQFLQDFCAIESRQEIVASMSMSFFDSLDVLCIFMSISPPYLVIQGRGIIVY